MGNDNKMIIHKPELKLFLADSMYPETKTEAQFYNLEEEYAKTKKNKNHSVVLILLALVLLVIGITYGITSFIAYQNKKIDVDFDVFADANLIELFDMVSRTEDALASAQSEKARLEILRQTEFEEIEARKEGDLYGLQNMRLTKAAQKQREKEIQAEYEKDFASAKDYYDRELVFLETSIDEYRKQLESLDSSRIKQAQEQQAALDFQRHIYEMEKVEVQEQYELRVQDLQEKLSEQQKISHERQKAVVDAITEDYQSFIALLDPVIEDKQVDEINEEIGQYIDLPSYRASDYILENDNEVFNELLYKIEHAYNSLDYLAQYVAAIPQEHSIPGILQTIESIYYVIGIELSNFASTELDRLHKMNQDDRIQYEQDLEEQKQVYEQELAERKQTYEQDLEEQKQFYEQELDNLKQSYEFAIGQQKESVKKAVNESLSNYLNR